MESAKCDSESDHKPHRLDPIISAIPIPEPGVSIVMENIPLYFGGEGAAQAKCNRNTRTILQQMLRDPHKQ